MHRPHDPSWCARLRAASPPAQPQPRIVDRADFDPRYDPAAPVICEVCGHEMRYTAACKLECRTCGYRRDCSDP